MEAHKRQLELGKQHRGDELARSLPLSCLYFQRVPSQEKWQLVEKEVVRLERMHVCLQKVSDRVVEGRP